MAAPANLPRGLEQKVKHVRKLMARADAAEELADKLQTREAEEAAIEAREEHLETAKLVARDFGYDDQYYNRNGLHLGVLGDLVDLDLGSETYQRNRGYYRPRWNRWSNRCRYGYC